MVAELEKKNVRIVDEYFASDARQEKPCGGTTLDIKIDDDYIQPEADEFIEGKETAFSEDEAELKIRARRFEKDLAAIAVPEFRALWKTQQSTAFSDFEVRSESAFRAGSALSIG